MNSGARTVIITGANRGIGYTIIERILQNSTPYDIILTSRDPQRGQEALDQLSKKFSSTDSSLTFCQLDVSDSKSIDNFVEWIKTKRDSKFDVLINNAGLDKRLTLEERLDIIRVNFFGAVELTEKLLPYLVSDGKIMMISSENGQLSWQPEKMHKYLEDPSLTREKVMDLANDLMEKTKTQTQTELGFSEATYDATKVLINAYTRWGLVKMVKGDQQCYTVDPGWCRTDMGGPSAPLAIERGADTPYYLLGLPYKYDEKYNGKFFRNCKLHDF